MSDSYTALRFEIIDNIGLVTFCKPESRNKISDELKDDFTRLLRILSNDRELSALVITGMDGSFCSGGDLKHLNQTQRSADWDRRRIYQLHDWVQLLMNLEMPVIAAVNGPAIGAGFGLALAADFILCSDQAYFRASFGRIGLVPDSGMFFTLPRMVGLQLAKEIIFTGRVVSVQEALACRIAMAVYTSKQLLPEAMKLAQRFRAAPTSAIGASKRILNQSFHLDARALVEMEAAAQAIFFQSEFHKAAVDDFMNKRPLGYDWSSTDMQTSK
ncbi:enoyl-CoA hydratase/isomerase family protein [Alcaligenaceae bacterium]|nr:enoyl-CoA hydratase/isomerase family protein [Alcaligenaceae bacterium]